MFLCSMIWRLVQTLFVVYECQRKTEIDGTYKPYLLRYSYSWKGESVGGKKVCVWGGGGGLEL